MQALKSAKLLVTSTIVSLATYAFATFFNLKLFHNFVLSVASSRFSTPQNSQVELDVRILV